MATPFVAIVLIDADRSKTLRVAGLSLAERAVRVAQHHGASEVFELGPDDREWLRTWRPCCERLLVLRATDQLVHLSLIRAIVDDDGDAVAVAPAAADASDLLEGEYAGAFITRRGTETISALADGRDDHDLASRLLADGASRHAHGAIARHPVTNSVQREAAEKLLYRILVKPQDNIIARRLFRPISFPLTRLLAATPITPNQITTVTMMLVAFGIWLTARPELHSVTLGSLVILISSYIDCCDGEIARLKLRSSRLGAWYDTVVDEMSSLGYMLALGWHCHLHFGPSYFGSPGIDPWLVAIMIGIATYSTTLYCVYYNIIVVAHSANSQDYVSRVQLEAGPLPGYWHLRPVSRQPFVPPAHWPIWKRSLVGWLPQMVRRDFIVWASLLLVFFGLTHLVFAAMVTGGVMSAAVVSVDHFRLRSQLGELRTRLAIGNV